jgi:hypothetical protein
LKNKEFLLRVVNRSKELRLDFKSVEWIKGVKDSRKMYERLLKEAKWCLEEQKGAWKSEGLLGKWGFFFFFFFVGSAKV